MNQFFCRLCGSSKNKNHLELKNFPKAAQHFLNSIEEKNNDIPVQLDVSECKSCGLIQLKNEPVSYYKDVITAASLSKASKDKLIKEWMPLIKKYKLKKTDAIEVGSCRGDFLEVLSELGFEVQGIENSAESCNISSSKGFNTIHGYLEDIASKLKNKFSLVVCNNFLEHQPRTSNFIQGFNEILNESGILYVSVPNLTYLTNKSCLYEFVSDHLVYFTEKTLKLAFEMNGFDVLEQYEKNNGNDLVIIAKKRPLKNFRESEMVVEQILQSLKKLISDAKNQNLTISVWSAGHRALALMAMVEMDYITNVIDSADFKQGKLTPILHKKIISPEVFLSNPSDIIILMLPGTYSSQVKTFLKENNVKTKVYIFEDEPIKS